MAPEVSLVLLSCNRLLFPLYNGCGYFDCVVGVKFGRDDRCQFVALYEGSFIWPIVTKVGEEATPVIVIFVFCFDKATEW